MNISTLVGLKDNLEYSKNFYKTFREIYPEEELIFVSYGSTDGTHGWLCDLRLTDPNVKAFFDYNKKTFSDTYNKAIEIATKDFVVFAHNDMVVSSQFLENLEKYLHKDRVISYTTVEPPIFAGHERPGKIIRDFGSDFNNFERDKFVEFALNEKLSKKNTTQDGITFFMSLSRQVLLDMGGFDNIFNPYYCEDDDLIRRLKGRGLKCLTSLDSIVYHFVSKTSRFSEEGIKNTQRIEENSNRTYIRKWGSYDSNNLFDIGFVIKNCNIDILKNMEPWASDIYLECDKESIIQEYIEAEQKNTSFNLSRRISSSELERDNDILIYFDGNQLNNNNFHIIRNIQNILGDIKEPGNYEMDIFTINVINIENYYPELIFI